MRWHLLMKWIRLVLTLLAAVGLCEAVQANTGRHTPDTTPPIKHPVVFFQKNVSSDHSFATYVDRGDQAAR
jgi:phospholipase C